MAPDVIYRDYRIVLDVKQEPGTGFWEAKAAVVEPADASGVEKVHPMEAIGYFLIEKAATEFIDRIIVEAKKWIDGQLRC